MVIASIYGRVSEEWHHYVLSTASQTNLNKQEELCRKYINDNNWERHSDYIDFDPNSTDIEERIFLEELCDDAKRGMFDTIIVYSKDQLSSDPIKYAEIMGIFKGLNLTLVIYEEEVKTGRYDPTKFPTPILKPKPVEEKIEKIEKIETPNIEEIKKPVEIKQEVLKFNLPVFNSDKPIKTQIKDKEDKENEHKTVKPSTRTTKARQRKKNESLIEQKKDNKEIKSILDIKKSDVTGRGKVVAIYAARDIDYNNNILRGMISTDPTGDVDKMTEILVENGYEILQTVIEETDFENIYNRPKLIELILNMNKNKVTLLCIPSMLNFCNYMWRGLNFFTFLSKNCSVMPIVYGIIKDEFIESLRILENLKPSRFDAKSFATSSPFDGIISSSPLFLFGKATNKVIAWFGDNRIVFETEEELLKILQSNIMKEHKKLKIYKLIDLSLIAKFTSKTSIYDSREDILKKVFNENNG